MFIDEWIEITCHLTSFSTVFQEIENERLCGGTPFTIEKISHRAGIDFGPLDQ